MWLCVQPSLRTAWLLLLEMELHHRVLFALEPRVRKAIRTEK